MASREDAEPCTFHPRSFSFSDSSTRAIPLRRKHQRTNIAQGRKAGTRCGADKHGKATERAFQSFLPSFLPSLIEKPPNHLSVRLLSINTREYGRDVVRGDLERRDTAAIGVTNGGAIKVFVFGNRALTSKARTTADGISS